jgi:hypothetical protein
MSLPGAWPAAPNGMPASITSPHSATLRYHFYTKSCLRAFPPRMTRRQPGEREIAAAWIGKEKLRDALNLRTRVTGSTPCERQVRDRLFSFYDWCRRRPGRARRSPARALAWRCW